MPVTIKTAAMKYKNSGGTYVGIDAVAETTTSQQVTAINNAGAAQVAAVQAQGATTLASIPQDYTTLSNNVSDLQSHVTYLDDSVFPIKSISGWAIGSYNTTYGTVETSITSRIRYDSVNKNYFKMKTPDAYSIVVFGYNATGEYLGIWNGTAFAKAFVALNGGVIDFNEIVGNNNYILNVAIGDGTGQSVTNISSISSNILFYEEVLTKIENRIFATGSNVSGWSLGTYNTVYGIEATSDTKIRYPKINKLYNSIQLPNGYDGVVFCYDDQGEYLGIWDGKNIAKSYKPVNGTIDLDSIVTFMSGGFINFALGNGSSITDIEAVASNVILTSIVTDQIPNTVCFGSDQHNTITIAKNATIFGNGNTLDLGVHLTATQGAQYLEIPYVATATDRIYKVCVDKSLPVLFDSSVLSVGYNTTLWAIYQDETLSFKLQPVTSDTDLASTDNSFYYDGTKIYINIETPALEYVLADGPDYGIIVLGGNVEINNLTVQFAFTSNVYIMGGNVRMDGCKFKYTSVSTGVKINDVSSVEMKNCEVFKSRFDGISVTGEHASSTFINCKSTYNYDDGISHHSGNETFYIEGGEYAHNVKGGVASPCYDSVGNISNAYIHDNQYGIYAIAEHHVDGNVMISNCIFENNTQNVINYGYRILLKNNTFGDATYPNYAHEAYNSENIVY